VLQLVKRELFQFLSKRVLLELELGLLGEEVVISGAASLSSKMPFYFFCVLACLACWRMQFLWVGQWSWAIFENEIKHAGNQILL
jgi:hypothetical protein